MELETINLINSTEYENPEYDPTQSYSLNLKDEDFSKSFLEYIINTLKYDHLMNLDAKVNFTSLVISYRSFLTDLEDFFEEECHLTLLNWIYKQINAFRSREVDEKLFHLLYNIIIIFEIIPIKVADLLELKIFEKLNKIRKYIENKNVYIYQQLDRLLKYWTEFCSGNCFWKGGRGLGKKRNRDESEESDDDCNNLETESNTSFDNQQEQKDILNINKNKTKTKTVIWDKQLTKTKIYDKEESPEEFSLNAVDYFEDVSVKEQDC